MRAPLVWLFAILVVPQRHIRCVECMHGLPEDVVVPFFEGKISKFDKDMLLNWVTQPLTRHLFDFFQNLLESARLGGLGPGALDIRDPLMEGIVSTLGVHKHEPQD